LKTFIGNRRKILQRESFGDNLTFTAPSRIFHEEAAPFQQKHNLKAGDLAGFPVPVALYPPKMNPAGLISAILKWRSNAASAELFAGRLTGQQWNRFRPRVSTAFDRTQPDCHRHS
jgi:hypothetical protein